MTNQWDTRAWVLLQAVRRRIKRKVLGMTRTIVEYSGGEWSPDVRAAAAAVVDAELRADHCRLVLLYHATEAASEWPDGSRDDDFPRTVRGILRSVGPLMPQCTVGKVIDALCGMTDEQTRCLPAQVVSSIVERFHNGDPEGPAAQAVG